MAFKDVLSLDAMFLRITNDSSATQRVSSYLTWYEGQTDFPSTDYQ